MIVPLTMAILLLLPTLAFSEQGVLSVTAGALTEGRADKDQDGDGFDARSGDCDESEALTYPGAREINDGKDNNCNGLIDESEGTIDGDLDGFSLNGGDCNDADPSVYPGAPEKLGDGLDNDCNGLIDDSFDTDRPKSRLGSGHLGCDMSPSTLCTPIGSFLLGLILLGRRLFR